MSREDIIRMAQQAGLWNVLEVQALMPELERFATFVASMEREACAKVCEKQGRNQKAMQHHSPVSYTGAAHDCANAVRRR